jgi:hypothetical protein
MNWASDAYMLKIHEDSLIRIGAETSHPKSSKSAYLTE